MTTQPNTASVSAYRKSKSTSLTTRGFGLNLGLSLRDRWVTPGAERVTVKLEGFGKTLDIKLLRGFWKKCPEFMDDRVYEWIADQGLLIPWPEGKPYRFEMERLNGTKFVVRRAIRH